MPTISITVPTDKANKVYDAFKKAYGHEEESPTAQQKLDFVKSRVVSYIKEVVNSDEVNTAIKTAKEGVVQDDTVAS